MPTFRRHFNVKQGFYKIKMFILCITQQFEIESPEFKQSTFILKKLVKQSRWKVGKPPWPRFKNSFCISIGVITLCAKVEVDSRPCDVYQLDACPGMPDLWPKCIKTGHFFQARFQYILALIWKSPGLVPTKMYWNIIYKKQQICPILVQSAPL